jgi:carbonic anhydrase
MKRTVSGLASIAVLPLLLIAASCATSKAGSPGARPVVGDPCAVPWSYAGETRPDLWGSLSACYDLCAAGKEQSPADLTVSVQAPLDPLEFKYSQNATLSVINDGHTVKAYAPAGSRLAIGANEFELKEFHFHTLSEHRLDGRQTPLELHLVNQAGERTAAVGVFIVQDPQNQENPQLAKIWRHLEEYNGKPRPVDDVDIMALLPASHASFRYAGSLTTPPCGQGLQWVVLSTPITASREQIERFEKLLAPAGNSRPLQPLNQRTVTRDF